MSQLDTIMVLSACIFHTAGFQSPAPASTHLAPHLACRAKSLKSLLPQAAHRRGGLTATMGSKVVWRGLVGAGALAAGRSWHDDVDRPVPGARRPVASR